MINIVRNLNSSAMAASEEASLAVMSIVIESFLDDQIERAILDTCQDTEDGEVLLVYEAMREKREKLKTYVEEYIPKFAPSVFKDYFRISSTTFDAFVNSLRMCPSLANGETVKPGRPRISLIRGALITLWYLATKETVIKIAHRFAVAEGTVCNYVSMICDAVTETLAAQYIKWPGSSDIGDVTEGFAEKSGFPGVIGAVDVIHVPIKAPQQSPELGDDYVNRNQTYSILLQAVCSHDLSFIDCSCGWPGSTRDAQAFQSSGLYQGAIEDPSRMFPSNTHIVADSAYPLDEWLMTPYEDNGFLTEKERIYNDVLARSRSYIVHAFAMLKSRFCRLKRVEISNVEKVSKLVLTCCVLHNLCLQTEDDVDIDEFTEDYTDDVEDIIMKRNIFGYPRQEAIIKRNGIAEAFYQQHLRNTYSL
ncbi:uncharacterized protein [Centruroides vittatus]|uniref:uncharacterized protein n=1 Tax=Centruroides vittatus TaxID=120091 RepID=UPI00350F5F02